MQPYVTAKRGDISDRNSLTQRLAGHDAYISWCVSRHNPAKPIGAANGSKVGRYLVVDDAGSLDGTPGVRSVTAPGFPVAYKAEAEQARSFLEPAGAAKATKLDVSFAVDAFVAGERTGKFRLGTGRL